MNVPAIPTIKCEDGSPAPRVSLNDGEPTGGGGYNLNVNLGAVSNLLAVESATSTPRTPEIVNSLIAMTNPMDQYNYNTNDKCPTPGYKSGSGNDSNSSMSNGSPATSPASGTPPSIQKTCSDLIKAGLKLSIESKRKMSGSDTDTSCVKRLKREDSDDEYDSSHAMTSKGDGLTPEDEERRRRRRERNKIAATKCRLKKRERTVNLVTESEVLENQNIELKSQLKDLELQKRRLSDMLQIHNACCPKNKSSPSPTAPYMIRPYESPTTFPAAYETNSPYIRPESANILTSSYTCITSINGESSIDTISSLDSTYITPPLIESVYNRPESVMSLPNHEVNFTTTDGYLPKATNLLVIEPTETEYYDHEINYNLTTQQCHTYPGTVTDAQSKINNGLNDGCLV